MNITCTAKPASGSVLTISTAQGQTVDTFDVPTHNGLIYCMNHKTSKYTRRLQLAVAIAARLEAGDQLPEADQQAAA